MTAVTERRRPSDLFRKRLKYWRRQRGLSVRELAERVADLGGTLTAAVIYKIEQGNKTGVTIDDWLLLAHALAVPPLVLLMDLEQGTELEIAPKAVVHPWLVWRWITGEVAPVLRALVEARPLAGLASPPVQDHGPDGVRCTSGQSGGALGPSPLDPGGSVMSDEMRARWERTVAETVAVIREFGINAADIAPIDLGSIQPPTDSPQQTDKEGQES